MNKTRKKKRSKVKKKKPLLNLLQRPFLHVTILQAVRYSPFPFHSCFSSFVVLVLIYESDENTIVDTKLQNPL